MMVMYLSELLERQPTWFKRAAFWAVFGALFSGACVGSYRAGYVAGRADVPQGTIFTGLDAEQTEFFQNRLNAYRQLIKEKE